MFNIVGCIVKFGFVVVVVVFLWIWVVIFFQFIGVCYCYGVLGFFWYVLGVIVQIIFFVIFVIEFKCCVFNVYIYFEVIKV